MISGFKAFDKGLITLNNNKLEVGKIYIAKGIIKFKQNGYHLCKNIEDTLRYVNGLNNDIDICRVYGFGNVDEYCDEYYGYYNLYSVQKLLIDNILSYDEIIDIAKRLPHERLIRFIQGYRINQNDLEYFKKNDNTNYVTKHIEYYQENKKYVFRK